MSLYFKQMLYVCVLCASCGNPQCCVLHDLQFVNAGRGCERRPYGKIIHQSRSHDCLVGVAFCLPYHVAVSAFIICRCLGECTEMCFFVFFCRKNFIQKKILQKSTELILYT